MSIMRSNIYHVLDEMNRLDDMADKYSDKAYEKYQEGNTKSSDYYEKKSDKIESQIEGIKLCLKTLGLNAWRDNVGRWHIPLDDIERVC